MSEEKPKSPKYLSSLDVLRQGVVGLRNGAEIRLTQYKTGWRLEFWNHQKYWSLALTNEAMDLIVATFLWYSDFMAQPNPWSKRLDLVDWDQIIDVPKAESGHAFEESPWEDD